MSDPGVRMEGDDAVRADLKAAIDGLPAFFKEEAGIVFTRLAARSVGTYMRNAHGEPDRRSKTDTGPLRVVSGRLAKAQSGGDTAGSREGIRRVRATKHGAKFVYGNRVPYGHIHEVGGTIKTKRATIVMPARPYNEPALDDETTWIQRRLETDFISYFNRHLGGGLT